MNCYRCNRPLTRATGTIEVVNTGVIHHYGPVCWARKTGKPPRKKRTAKVSAVHLEQPELFEPYFMAAGDRDRALLFSDKTDR